MPSTFEPLRKKLNSMCIQLVDGEPYCTLCDAKLPSQAQYDSHTGGKTHRAKSNSVYKQLMKATLSPGIVMSASGQTIHCILCRRFVSNYFDTAFHDHVLSSEHRRMLLKNECMGTDELEAYYTGVFSSVCLEDAFLKGVSRAGIVVTSDHLFHCVPCECKFANRKQFTEHVKGEMHRTWVFGQLLKVAHRVGLSLGVVVKKGSLVCKLCDCTLGNGLATSEAHRHITTDPQHKKIAEQQIFDGVFEYYYQYCYDSDADDDDNSSEQDQDDKSITRSYDDFIGDSSSSYQYSGDGNDYDSFEDCSYSSDSDYSP